jgi:hypothetical protein
MSPPGPTAAAAAVSIAWLCSFAPAPATAQMPEFTIGAAGAAVELRSVLDGNLETYTGFLYGGEGSVRWNRLTLRLGYGQGSLERANVRFTDRQFADGYARIDVTVLPGLEFGAGPHARAYSTGSPSGPSLLRLAIGGGTAREARRWLLWELHGRYEAPVIAPVFALYADGWLTRPGRLNPQEVYYGGRGGEVGLRVNTGSPPLTVRFGYAIDEIRLGPNVRRETVERVMIAVGVTWGASQDGAAAVAPARQR